MNSVLAKLVFLKVSPDMAMLFYQRFVHRKGETANPVPAKVILQVSPDSVMLFSQPICVHRMRETAHPEKWTTLTLRRKMLH